MDKIAEKIAISVDGNQVSAHFGRCPSFVMIEMKNGRIINREEIPNPGHLTGFLPDFLAQKGVNLIICGGMGKKAIALFLEKGIKPMMGISGEVDEVIEKYVQGQLQEGDSLCQPGSGKGYGMEKEDQH